MARRGTRSAASAKAHLPRACRWGAAESAGSDSARSGRRPNRWALCAQQTGSQPPSGCSCPSPWKVSCCPSGPEEGPMARSALAPAASNTSLLEPPPHPSARYVHLLHMERRHCAPDTTMRSASRLMSHARVACGSTAPKAAEVPEAAAAELSNAPSACCTALSTCCDWSVASRNCVARAVLVLPRAAALASGGMPLAPQEASASALASSRSRVNATRP